MFTEVDTFRQFLLAGAAIVTIQSQRTGKHYTYQVRKKEYEGKDPFYFVSLLTGPDNERDYTYLGRLVVNERSAWLKPTPASKLDLGSPSVTALAYVLNNVFRHERMPAQCEVRHEGRCGRCARKLTHPTSLATGLGPECGAAEHALYEAVTDFRQVKKVAS
jgi:hypothetical protein